MSIPLPPGCLADTLCRAGECGGCEPLFANRDPALARLALTPALLHPGAMASLRRSAVELAGGAALDRLDDHAVLAVLSDAVAAGRLQLCRAQAGADPGADASAEGAQEGPVDIGVALKQTEAARAPTSAPRMAAAPRPPPPPPPAPPAPAPPEIDAAAQAATLREAARSGVPFCAECEKARAARAAREAAPA